MENGKPARFFSCMPFYFVSLRCVLYGVIFGGGGGGRVLAKDK